MKKVCESRTASVHLDVAKWLLLAEKLCTAQTAGISLGAMPAERLYRQERVGHCTLCSCIKNELYNLLFIKILFLVVLLFQYCCPVPVMVFASLPWAGQLKKFSDHSFNCVVEKSIPRGFPKPLWSLSAFWSAARADLLQSKQRDC